MVVVFLFDGVDGTDDLGHGVQHSALRQGLRCQGLMVTHGAEPEAHKDVGEAEEAENENQSL